MRPARLVLVGHPVAHSLSPRIQNAALAHAQLATRYGVLDVAPEDLAETMRALVAMDAAGNVTIPHKEPVVALCHELTPVAERVGAVNTFWTASNRLWGDNTDVGGFDAAVHRAFGPPREGTRVAVLGAGGAAAAVLAAIERWNGATAVVASRTVARAARLVERFPRVAEVSPSFAAATAGASLVVNATPIGLHGADVPIDPALLAPDARVFDLVYRRGETPWVIRARARGLEAADGLDMLVEQGALSFLRWFGRAPDRDVMRRAAA
jgi:shikimate dehydrogenase